MAKNSSKSPKHAHQKRPATMTEMPLDTTGPVMRFLPAESVIAYSLTCQRARSDSQIQRLVQHVVYGEEIQARHILDDNPALLFKKATVMDYADRRIEDTPFKAALRAGDIKMCEMMRPYFIRAVAAQEKSDKQYETTRETRAQKEIQRQTSEIFPSDFNAHIQKQADTAFDFSEILAAIINASDAEIKLESDKPGQDNKLPDSEENTPLCKALNRFRQGFDAHSKRELIFNPHNYLRALEGYIAGYPALLAADTATGFWWRRDVFLRQVIGYTQRYFPACDMQAVAQGYYYIASEGETPQRSFNLRRDKGTVIPLEVAAGLGYSYALACEIGCRHTGFQDDDVRLLTCFRAYLKYKQDALDALLTLEHDKKPDAELFKRTCKC